MLTISEHFPHFVNPDSIILSALEAPSTPAMPVSHPTHQQDHALEYEDQDMPTLPPDQSSPRKLMDHI
jgi:hypothetical protein